jgi:hypothetical protein
MRFLPLLLIAAPLLADTAPRPPRGPAASPEALAWQRYAAQSKTALATLTSPAPVELPPAPDGVSPLAFAEFFGPIGDRGLEFSEKIRGLAGRRVRLVGYMVRESDRGAGVFRLAGWPVTVEATGFCTVDDTPPHTVHVIDPTATGVPAWQPGRLVLVGTLEVGFRAAADGRNSHLRLMLDPADAPRI